MTYTNKHNQEITIHCFYYLFSFYVCLSSIQISLIYLPQYNLLLLQTVFFAQFPEGREGPITYG